MANKFSAAGSINNNSSTSGYQLAKGAKPDPIGLKPTEAVVTTNRRWIIGLVLGLIAVAVVAIVAVVYSTGIDKPYQVRESDFKNKIMSRNVEIFLQNGDIQDGGVVCSGVFIRETGEILTASHCFYEQNPNSCDFVLTPTPHYTSTIETLTIEVMNVNKTGAKYAFTGQLLFWSGTTDVAIVKTTPLTRSDGSVINAVNQHHYNFAGGDIEPGDTLNAFGYDNGFFKKAYRTGVISHPNLDIGTLIAASSEQVFVAATGREGSSGSGWADREGNLVLAPLSFGWSWWSAYDQPDSLNPSGTAGTSGTSYRVSKPLVSRMLNPNTPPNGVNGQYLVPTLGIIVGGPVDAYTLWYDFSTGFYPETEMKGIIISLLATQSYFDDEASCGQAYNVTKPSLLDAPLEIIINGDPPLTFPAIPNGGDSNTLVILEAIEGNLNEGNWVWMGSDAGLGTVSGTIIGNGNWVGDVIRVRIRSINFVAPSDDTKNWEAIYDVTLEAVDPFWDIAYGAPFATYASLLLVNDSTTPPTIVVPPGIMLPTPLRGSMPGPHRPAGPAATRSQPSKNVYVPSTRSARRVRDPAPAPPGADTSALPTIVQHYLNGLAKRDYIVRSNMERSARERAEFLAERKTRLPPLHRHGAPLAAHHRQAPAAAKTPAQKHSGQRQRQQQPERRRPGQHLKGRRH